MYLKHLKKGEDMPKLMFCNKCGKVSLDGKNGDKCYWCKKGHFFDSGFDYSEARKIVEKDYHISLGDCSMEQEEFLRKRFFYSSSFNDSEQKLISKRMAYDEAYQQKKQDDNTPKCPVCGSTYLRKVTATRKILKVGLFGRLGTGDLGKTYQCCKCGAKF